MGNNELSECSSRIVVLQGQALYLVGRTYKITALYRSRREEGKLKERRFFWALLDVDWEDCTLWKAHPNSLHCNSQGERKENEEEKCLEIFPESLSDSIFAWIASVLDANYWYLEKFPSISLRLERKGDSRLLPVQLFTRIWRYPKGWKEYLAQFLNSSLIFLPLDD